MNWDIFYNSYSKMTDSVLRETIISLYEIGSGEVITDVVTDINNAEIKLRLIDKALELKATFTESDFVRLEGEIPPALLVKLARFGEIEFGNGNDVADAITSIYDDNVGRSLYERAYVDDVRFTQEHLDRMGYENIDSAHDPLVEDSRSQSKRYGCLAAFIGLGTVLGRRKRKK